MNLSISKSLFSLVFINFLLIQGSYAAPPLPPDFKPRPVPGFFSVCSVSVGRDVIAKDLKEQLRFMPYLDVQSSEYEILNYAMKTRVLVYKAFADSTLRLEVLHYDINNKLYHGDTKISLNHQNGEKFSFPSPYLSLTIDVPGNKISATCQIITE